MDAAHSQQYMVASSVLFLSSALVFSTATSKWRIQEESARPKLTLGLRLLTLPPNQLLSSQRLAANTSEAVPVAGTGSSTKDRKGAPKTHVPSVSQNAAIE